MSRRWFITGGTPGNFGMAFAEAALETGDRVVLTSRRPQELTTWTQQYGDHVLVVPMDVTDTAAVQRAVRTAEEAGVTLVAVARRDGFEVFAGARRIDL